MAGKPSAKLVDGFGRTIDYLRVSITDRCPLRCVYCTPRDKIKWKQAKDILSYEEIFEFVKKAVELGIRKVRVTGGEPLTRKDICQLIAMLSSLPGIRDLALTTNGVLLEQYAGKLKRAGLHRVNISLDSLDAGKYREITGGGELARALKGIEAAKKAGLTPIKINCVVLKGINDDETEAITAYGKQDGLGVQFIQRMRLDHNKPKADPSFVTSRPPPCGTCNRLRLTADGVLKPCLLSNQGLSIRSFKGDLEGAIRQAVADKPESGEKCPNHSMMEIGG